MTAVMEPITAVCPPGVARHRSLRAWRRGCRCPEAIAAHERMLAGKRAEERRLPPRPVRSWLLRGVDPRKPWRDGTRRTKVDRHSLFLLVHGFIDAPTRAELRAAVAILSQRGHVISLNPLTNVEIGERIGVSHEEVRRLRTATDVIREQRAARRLADVKWRMQRAARREAKQRRDSAASVRTARAKGRRVEVLDGIRVVVEFPQARLARSCTTCDRAITVGERYRRTSIPPGRDRNGWQYLAEHEECAGG